MESSTEILKKKKLIILKWQIKNLSIKILKTLIKPFTFIEKEIIEPIAHWLDEWDLFKIFEKIGILIAIIIFIIEVGDRTEQRIFEAWQVVKDGKNSRTGVVKLALERLDKEGFSLLGIDAENTNLQKIELINANLKGANFRRADLRGADLRDANLTVAKLTGAKLMSADLTGAKLMSANLTGANLSGANLWRADLWRADLTGADLTGANLRGTNLRGADLRGADLRFANLVGADLRAADLRRAKFWDKDKYLGEVEKITPEQIKEAENWWEAVYSPEFRRNLGLPPADK